MLRSDLVMLKYFILSLFLFIALSSSFCKASDQRDEFLLKGYSASLKHNYQEAFKWYKKAAELGDAVAMGWLGLMYSEGKGTLRDDKEAFKWFKKAAELGNAKAMGMLGGMYFRGAGTLKDYKEAFKWCKKSAELGNADVMHLLGLMYFQGIGIPKNPQQAKYWIKKSYDAGNKNAQDFWNKHELWKY